jgi:hypothetical protein
MGWPLAKCLLWGLILVVQLHGHTGCLEEERMGLLKIKEFVINSNADYVDYLLPSWAEKGDNTVR